MFNKLFTDLDLESLSHVDRHDEHSFLIVFLVLLEGHNPHLIFAI